MDDDRGEIETGLQRQPLMVYDSVVFSDRDNKYPELFAKKEEVFGLLSGSERWTLCSQGEPIYSYAFVQCGAALVRNRKTGLITLIHESVWSDGADAALALQHNDDLDVITIEGPFSYMDIRKVKYAHEKDPEEALTVLEKVDREKIEEVSSRFG